MTDKKHVMTDLADCFQHHTLADAMRTGGAIPNAWSDDMVTKFYRDTLRKQVDDDHMAKMLESAQKRRGGALVKYFYKVRFETEYAPDDERLRTVETIVAPRDYYSTQEKTHMSRLRRWMEREGVVVPAMRLLSAVWATDDVQEHGAPSPQMELRVRMALQPASLWNSVHVDVLELRGSRVLTFFLTDPPMTKAAKKDLDNMWVRQTGARPILGLAPTTK